MLEIDCDTLGSVPIFMISGTRADLEVLYTALHKSLLSPLDGDMRTITVYRHGVKGVLDIVRSSDHGVKDE